ncbi:MAG: hypothetical protein K2I73_04840 [Eubacterium sp.]|nr:hypothetical protein [Eubacterium sp.]
MKIVNVEDILKDLNSIHSEKELAKFLKKYRKVQYIDIVVVNYAEELIKGADYNKGVMIIKGIYESKYLEYISDEITVYMILAQYYIENGEEENGKEFLKKIANETSDNYEEFLEFRGWIDVWNKYKDKVKDSIRESKSINNNAECITDDELLCLLLEEVHSGGYSSYLSYNSAYFECTLEIAKKRKMNALVQQLERIKAKFPNSAIPKDSSAIDAVLEKNSSYFDEEDELFYSSIYAEFPADI